MIRNTVYLEGVKRLSIGLVLPVLLAGCTGASQWLSGSSVSHNPSVGYPTELDAIQIGTTTKEEVQLKLGTPTDIQQSSGNGRGVESWAYAKSAFVVHPLRYVPGFGVLVQSHQHPRASFSISFSADGVVNGMVLREVQPMGDPGGARALLETPKISLYGSQNPLTRQSWQGTHIQTNMSMN